MNDFNWSLRIVDALCNVCPKKNSKAIFPEKVINGTQTFFLVMNEVNFINNQPFVFFISEPRHPRFDTRRVAHPHPPGPPHLPPHEMLRPQTKGFQIHLGPQDHPGDRLRALLRGRGARSLRKRRPPQRSHTDAESGQAGGHFSLEDKEPNGSYRAAVEDTSRGAAYQYPKYL